MAEPEVRWVAPLLGVGSAIVGAAALAVGAELLPEIGLDAGLGPLSTVALAWWSLGTAVVAPLALAAWRWPGASLPAAAGWVLAAATVGPRWNLWALSPTRGEFHETGPILSVWLLAGLPLIVIGSGRPSAGSVLTRAVVVWGAGYSALWLAILPTQVSWSAHPPTPVEVAIVVVLAGLWSGAVALACAFTGPLRPREQVLSGILAHPFLVAVGPDVQRTVWNLDWDHAEAIVAIGTVALVPSVGVVVGGLAAWLRARHRARAEAAEPPA